jgi:hypothetical protein
VSILAALAGILFLAIVFGPYRRGDTWAWWALLGGTAFLAVVILLRVPLLDTKAGAGAGAAPGGVSYDEFFGTASSAPARPSRTPDAKSDDLDQFHAWLQNLKR